MSPPKKLTPGDIGRALVAFRHASLTPKRRSEIATQAANARWAKKKPKPRRKPKPKKKTLK